MISKPPNLSNANIFNLEKKIRKELFFSSSHHFDFLLRFFFLQKTMSFLLSRSFTMSKNGPKMFLNFLRVTSSVDVRICANSCLVQYVCGLAIVPRIEIKTPLKVICLFFHFFHFVRHQICLSFLLDFFSYFRLFAEIHLFFLYLYNTKTTF